MTDHSKAASLTLKKLLSNLVDLSVNFIQVEITDNIVKHVSQLEKVPNVTILLELSVGWGNVIS